MSEADMLIHTTPQLHLAVTQLHKCRARATDAAREYLEKPSELARAVLRAALDVEHKTAQWHQSLLDDELAADEAAARADYEYDFGLPPSPLGWGG